MKHLSNWVEIPVLQMPRATAFYEAVFSTQLIPMELAGNRYALFPARDRFNTGALVQGDGYRPCAEGSLVYFDATGRMDTLLERVPQAGGRVLLPKTFLSDEAGEIALVLDSEGNRIGFQAAVERKAQAPISDETMQRLLQSTPPGLAFLLRKGPAWDSPQAQPLQWEHARNMFTLLRDERLRYVFPLMDGTDVVGFGVLAAATKADAEALLREDPAVRGGRITFQILTGAEFRAGEIAF